MRIKHNSDRFLVPMSVINDSSLSYKARGVYICRMSFPEKSRVSITQIASMAKDGRLSVKSGLEELKNAGYIKESSPGVLEVLHANN